MKNITKLLALALVVLGFSASSFGQNIANTTASGTVLAATSIVNTANLDFGTFIPGASAAGTVVVSPAGVRTQTSPVVLAIGTFSAATFTITGENLHNFQIIVPLGDHIITRVTGSETMTVNTFVSTPASGANGILSGTGTGTATVGATLHVGALAANPAGTYTNPAGFEVTVTFE